MAKKKRELELLEEYEYYLSHKEELLKKYEGQVIIIKGDQIRGPFSTIGEAYKAGLNEFGNVAMFIEQVTKEEPIIQIFATAPAMA